MVSLKEGVDRMKNESIEITSEYWLGEFYSNDGWKRLTLFYKVTNSHGGSVNTPIASINIVNHPGKDGCNSHSEIRISVRNDLKLQEKGIVVDKNATVLRHPTDIVDANILNSVIEKLKERNLATLPLSIYLCMEHVEKFETQGDFWSEY